MTLIYQIRMHTIFPKFRSITWALAPFSHLADHICLLGKIANFPLNNWREAKMFVCRNYWWTHVMVKPCQKLEVISANKSVDTPRGALLKLYQIKCIRFLGSVHISLLEYKANIRSTHLWNIDIWNCSWHLWDFETLIFVVLFQNMTNCVKKYLDFLWNIFLKYD